jgi:hypothetical protein
MAQAARVDSIEALKAFRASLLKFAESARNGLGSAEFDIHRADQWLKQEQRDYWKGTIRKRTEWVTRAKSALNQKKLYKSPMGGEQSCIEEEKALAVAKKRLEEAEEKADCVRKWTQKLEQERLLYKGQVQGIGRSLDVDVPNAVALLDRLLLSLEAYASPSTARNVGLGAGESAATQGTARGTAASMSRGTPDPRAAARDEAALLRRLVPPPAIRASVDIAPLGFSWKEQARIGEAHRRALADLPIESVETSPGDKVVLAPDVWNQRRIFLERATPKPDDSAVESRRQARSDGGWFVGAVDSDTQAVPSWDGLVAIRIRDLLALRPDFAEILALPPGCLAVVEGNVIERVWDGQGKLLLLVDKTAG